VAKRRSFAVSTGFRKDTALSNPFQQRRVLWLIEGLGLSRLAFRRGMAVGAEAPSLLAGLIVDAGGNRMTPTHATKKAKRYRY
jgi:hypothetical protein